MTLDSIRNSCDVFFKWLQGHHVGFLQMIFFSVQNSSFLWVPSKVCPRKRTTSKSVGSLRRPKVIGGRQLFRRQEEDSTSRPGGRKRRGSHRESSRRRRGADRGGGGGEGRARASARLLLLQVCLCRTVHCCALLSAGVPSARTSSCHRRHTTQSAPLRNSYKLPAQ